MKTDAQYGAFLAVVSMAGQTNAWATAMQVTFDGAFALG